MGKHNLDEKLRNAHMKDEDNIFYIPGLGHMLAWGDTVPSDGDSGYVTGCRYLHTDGGANDALYVNEGDEDSCDFNEVNTV